MENIEIKSSHFLTMISNYKRKKYVKIWLLLTMCFAHHWFSIGKFKSGSLYLVLLPKFQSLSFCSKEDFYPQCLLAGAARPHLDERLRLLFFCRCEFIQLSTPKEGWDFGIILMFRVVLLNCSVFGLLRWLEKAEL